MSFTAAYMQVSEGYIAFIEELPGVNTQAATLEEGAKILRKQLILSSKPIANSPKNLWRVRQSFANRSNWQRHQAGVPRLVIAQPCKAASRRRIPPPLYAKP